MSQPGKPILFSTPMVQAIDDRTKRMTRRKAKGVPAEAVTAIYGGAMTGTYTWFDAAGEPIGDSFVCPWGRVGEMLYVREEFRVSPFYDKMPPAKVAPGSRVRYEADPETVGQGWGKKRENLYMMRWMSRFTLGLSHIRLERLQDITDEDCYAEGITSHQVALADHYMHDHPFLGPAILRGGTAPRWAYAKLWEDLHGAGSWQENPFVWVLEFDTFKENIDSPV